jgi:NTE family protein
VTLAVLPLNDRVDVSGFVQQLYEAIKKKKKNVLLLTKERISQILGSKAISETRGSGKDRKLRLPAWLDEQEALHDYIFYVAEKDDSDWTWNCLRHADDVLLLARADDTPDLSRAERLFLHGEHKQIMASQSLVLLHPVKEQNTYRSNETSHWLRERRVQAHHHIRENPQDFDRLARVVCGETNGPGTFRRRRQRYRPPGCVQSTRRSWRAFR